MHKLLFANCLAKHDCTAGYLGREKYVKVALDKADRLEKLINELFEITKYNKHTVTLKKETINLLCLIAQVMDELYPALAANGNTAVF